MQSGRGKAVLAYASFVRCAKTANLWICGNGSFLFYLMSTYLQGYLDQLRGTRNLTGGTDLLYCSPRDPGLSKSKFKVVQFLNIRTPRDLCYFVGLTFQDVEQCLNHPGYLTFELDKKNGKGKRVIQEPGALLKQVHGKLNNGLQAWYAEIRPDCVHGFVRSEKNSTIGVVSNARVHVGKRFVLNMDLKDFFPSISAKRVKSVLQSPLFRLDDHMSTVLSLLMTYQGRLPQGAATSPVISNFVCLGLDLRIQELCKIRNWNYTRYADDLTFSGDLFFTDEDVQEIRELIQKEGFALNERKVRRKAAGCKQTVTGLVVNQKVNVDRRLIRKIRALLHDAGRNGAASAAMRHYGWNYSDDQLTDRFLNKIGGYISFVGMVRGREDKIYQNLRQAFNSVSYDAVR